MADRTQNEFLAGEKQIFDNYASKLMRLVFKDTEAFRAELNSLLDQLNSLDYTLRIATDEQAGRLLSQCCHLVPVTHEALVIKVCHLMAHMVSKQQMILNHKVEPITEYLVNALPSCSQTLLPDILKALAVILYGNGAKLSKFYSTLLGRRGLLAQYASMQEANVVRGAVQCLENICLRCIGLPYVSEAHWRECFSVLLHMLQTPKPKGMDDICHCKVLICSLRGIQSILMVTKSCDSESLGPLLAALKVYMLYGLPGTTTATMPTCLYPTPLSQYDPSPPAGAPKTPAPQKGEEEPTAGKTPSKTTQKKGKKRKGRGKKGDQEEEGVGALESDMDRLALSGDHSRRGQSSVVGAVEDAAELMMPWTRMSSSESELSDTEGGQGPKTRMHNNRVRQCATANFHALIKATDKRVLFGYWSAFIPDTPGIGGPPKAPTLFTAIMKDPSPKARTGALAVLTALMDGAKHYLQAAEEGDQYRNAPFTPFSVTLSHMIKEIHRCLLLALVSETSPLATTQIIKCLATLIPNVPYHRLKPGLLSRIVKQIKPFMSHRDPNIRVACLTTLGSIASVQAPMLEVGHILQPSRPPGRLSESVNSRTSDLLSAASRGEPESGYHSSQPSGAASASSSDGLLPSPHDVASSISSGIPTPCLSSGAQTPTLSDQFVYGAGGDVPWMIKLCVRNVAPHLLERVGDHDTARSRMLDGQGHTQPLPVRLESLQLLAHLVKGYFSLLRCHLILMRDVIHYCLDDKEPAVKLHGAKLLEEMGAILLQQPQPQKEPDPPSVDIPQILEIWLPLLNGPLPTVLQTAEYHAVRSTICDCLSNIGAQAFDQLPMDKRILCMTLLLGVTGDEDHHVRAAAIRALGVYVLYPCLREDVSFVADAANCVITALEETNLNVRVKAAWSLGNLSDALVLNKMDGDEAFMEDLSDMLLLKLFEASIRGSQDNDKVKSNAVRAIGNLMRYLPERSFRSSRFSSAIESSIQALIKNVSGSAMKVRWNACYATGNMFRNAMLPLAEEKWSKPIHAALMGVVKDCKNFKVRINAAMSLSIPAERHLYGDKDQYSAIWGCMIAALQSSESMVDFTEYKYRDNLVEQICSTVVHLMSLIEVNDLESVLKVIGDKISIIKAELHKYQTKAVQEDHAGEKGEIREKAQCHLEALAEDTSLNAAQSTAVKILQDMIAVQVEDVADLNLDLGLDELRQSTSAFVQTYD